MWLRNPIFGDNLTTPAFVLDNSTPDDVASAVIVGGSQQEPFFIFDMDEAYRHIQNFRNALPRVQIFYAMKANDSEMMIKLAIAAGLGFDCASPGEISKIRNFNINPTSIIYAVPTKNPDQMIYARLSGVKHTTFDSTCELYQLKKHWPDAKLLIRIKVNSDSVYKLAEKFGCDFETEAMHLLDTAASLGLTVIGVAFHVGSACSSLESYVVGLRQAKALFDYETKHGRQMKILDIGGGFFGGRTENEKFIQVSKLINETLTQLFPDEAVQVLAEPGRYLCESAFTLYCNINDVKQVRHNNKTTNMVYINNGIHGSLRFFEQWHEVRKFNTNSGDDAVEDTILWGPTSDSKDRMTLVKLPSCSSKDWLVFTMQGAYSITFDGNFSGFQIPKIRPVVSKTLWAHIKDNPVFEDTDFVTNPDISAPLPSTLPPVLKT